MLEEIVLKIMSIQFVVSLVLGIPTFFLALYYLHRENKKAKKEEFILGLYKNQCKDCVHGREYKCEKKQELLKRVIKNHDEEIENSCDRYIKKSGVWE